MLFNFLHVLLKVKKKIFLVINDFKFTEFFKI